METEHTFKTCAACGIEKNKTEFYRHKKYRDGLVSECKACVSSIRIAKNRANGAQSRTLQILPDGKLTCNRCGDAKPLAEFTQDKKARLGCKGHCKVCENEYAEARRRAKGSRPLAPKPDVPAGFKFCTRCQTTQSVNNFGERLDRKDGLRPWCNECRRVTSRKWNSRNREYIKERTAKSSEKRWACRLRIVFGITAEQHAAILEKQGGCCAICKRADFGAKSFRHWSVDHCHQTEARNKAASVRGLLCHKCNILLENTIRNPEKWGFARSAPHLLKAALTYLQSPPARQVLFPAP